MSVLPVDSILPELRSILNDHPSAVLCAEPGAGKTTRVPLALLDEPWLQGKRIIMLEPRRMAAVRSAEYMAEQRNEALGVTVGYRIRGENTTTRTTKLDVVTEGILTRMIQDDASLEGIGLIIFDEFHERSIHADLGLALALDIREHLRSDLKLLVMSATLDAARISELMGNAPVVKSHGRVFPVSVSYLSQPHKDRIDTVAANAIVKAVREQEGDILVFLPGQREIRNVESLLKGKELPPNIIIHLLYGEASASHQRAALQPARSGQRKIILSTNIAETSLTIEGVRTVIDAGLMRTTAFDPRRGMSGLVTIPVSLASAEQRKGRAGRVAAGHCYRLWTEGEHSVLSPYSKPEINTADLAPLAMELALWGDGEAQSLRFLDPPPKANLLQARTLLTTLGALDNNGTLTGHGKRMAALPVHPRFAHMLLTGMELGKGVMACDIAALLEERDALRGNPSADIDLWSRYSAYRNGELPDRSAAVRIKEQSRRLRSVIGLQKSADAPAQSVHEGHGIGVLLALAYPERIGKKKKGEKYQLSGNMTASVPKTSALSREEYLAVGDVDGAGSDIRIFLAEPLTEGEIRAAFKEQIRTAEQIEWDETNSAIAARTVTTLGSIELSARSFVPTNEQTLPLMLEAIHRFGLSVLLWTKSTASLVERSEWLRKNGLVSDWPDLSPEQLLGTMNEWLAPFLSGMTRKQHLTRLEMDTIIRSLFSYQQLQMLDRLAPTHLTVPTGSQIALDYSNHPPILAVRLQEMFGETETPSIGGGKVNVLLHLLSPARRPLAVTQDLPSFWNNAYIQVRKDMRGEYPKHYWPEDPLQAEPTRKTKRGMGGTPT
jgi:ATP-dependent helicase HrpB